MPYGAGWWIFPKTEVDQRICLAIPVRDDAPSYRNIGRRPIGTINRHMARVRNEG